MKTKQDLYSSRPVSPHLTIYRPQISSVLSIFHRMTGAFLFCALSIITWIFILHIFGMLDLRFFLSNICICLLKAIGYFASVAFFYHISTGIRHLIWDLGCFMSKRALHISGWVAISCAIIASSLFWYLVL